MRPLEKTINLCIRMNTVIELLSLTIHHCTHNLHKSRSPVCCIPSSYDPTHILYKTLRMIYKKKINKYLLTSFNLLSIHFPHGYGGCYTAPMSDYTVDVKHPTLTLIFYNMQLSYTQLIGRKSNARINILFKSLNQ